MKIVHSSDAPWVDALKQGAYSNRRKELASGTLNASLWELPPGKKSFPLHAHQITEEALFVLSGRAKVRTTEGESAIGPGDWVTFPAGGPAHQLINDGTEPLVYVAMSVNSVGADIVMYPDTGKVAAAVGKFPTGKRFIFAENNQVGYLDGDPDAQAK